LDGFGMYVLWKQMSKIIRTKQLLNSVETIRIHPKNPEFRERERALRTKTC
jgi:hypothetical protein